MSSTRTPTFGAGGTHGGVPSSSLLSSSPLSLSSSLPTPAPAAAASSSSSSSEQARPRRLTLAPTSSKKRRVSVYAVEDVERPPIFIYSTVLICIAVTFLELYTNGLNRGGGGGGDAASAATDAEAAAAAAAAGEASVGAGEIAACPVKLWIFCFESMKSNPFLGPSADTLIRMGAKTGKMVVEQREWGRLFKCM